MLKIFLFLIFIILFHYCSVIPELFPEEEPTQEDNEIDPIEPPSKGDMIGVSKRIIYTDEKGREELI